LKRYIGKKGSFTLQGGYHHLGKDRVRIKAKRKPGEKGNHHLVKTGLTRNFGERLVEKKKY